MKTRVLTVTCPNKDCSEEIYSRARHDFHYCKCGEIFCDGGFEYMRVGWEKEMPKQRIRYVNASRQELYDDWNKRIDKFGRIEKKNKSIES